MKVLFLFLSLLIVGTVVSGQLPDSNTLKHFDSWPIDYRHKKKKLPKLIFTNLKLMQVQDDEEFNNTAVDAKGIFGYIQESRSARLIFMHLLYRQTDTIYVKAELVNLVSGSGKPELVKVTLGDANKDDLAESNFCSKAFFASTISKARWEYQFNNDPKFKQTEFLTNGKDTIHITRSNWKKEEVINFKEKNSTIAACRFSKDPMIWIAKKEEDEKRKMIAAAMAVIISATDF